MQCAIMIAYLGQRAMAGGNHSHLERQPEVGVFSGARHGGRPIPEIPHIEMPSGKRSLEHGV